MIIIFFIFDNSHCTYGTSCVNNPYYIKGSNSDSRCSENPNLYRKVCETLKFWKRTECCYQEKISFEQLAAFFRLDKLFYNVDIWFSSYLCKTKLVYNNLNNPLKAWFSNKKYISFVKSEKKIFSDNLFSSLWIFFS